MKKRVYHLQDKDDVEIVGIKKDSIGFRKGNRNRISAMYNIRCDLDHGVGKAAVRRTPIACLFCIEQLNLLWDKNVEDTNQRRYGINKQCLNWNIFEGLKDWNIITLVTQIKNKNIDKEDEAFRTILRGVKTRMSEKILSTMYGVIRTNDKSDDGYYVLRWTSEPYIL